VSDITVRVHYGTPEHSELMHFHHLPRVGDELRVYAPLPGCEHLGFETIYRVARVVHEPSTALRGGATSVHVEAAFP
jgi:hypothetical protein